MRDVERALASDYPDHLAHKLVDRKAKCCMKLGFFGEAVNAFEKALELGRRSNVELKESEKLMKSCMTKKNTELLFSIEDEAPASSMPMLTGVNPQMPSFSRAVLIGHSADKGRHGVATRKIECGEVIMVEKSDFFNAPLSHCRGRVCTHCLKPTLDMIPSPVNTKVEQDLNGLFLSIKNK